MCVSWSCQRNNNHDIHDTLHIFLDFQCKEHELNYSFALSATKLSNQNSSYLKMKRFCYWCMRQVAIAMSTLLTTYFCALVYNADTQTWAATKMFILSLERLNVSTSSKRNKEKIKVDTRSQALAWGMESKQRHQKKKEIMCLSSSSVY